MKGQGERWRLKVEIYIRVRGKKIKGSLRKKGNNYFRMKKAKTYKEKKVAVLPHSGIGSQHWREGLLAKVHHLRRGRG